MSNTGLRVGQGVWVYGISEYLILGKRCYIFLEFGIRYIMFFSNFDILHDPPAALGNVLDSIFFFTFLTGGFIINH